jgi:hypothetical protein
MSRLLAVTVLATVVAVLAGCGGGGESAPTDEEYEQAVVTAVDRTDFALARITRAKSMDELVKRMGEAEVAIASAASNLEEHGAPELYADENAKLVKSLKGLGNDVGLTAEQIQQPGFESLLLGARGLSFENWDKVNLALASLLGSGLDVQTLQRH